jgi:hypothetical protein
VVKERGIEQGSLIVAEGIFSAFVLDEKQLKERRGRNVISEYLERKCASGRNFQGRSSSLLPPPPPPSPPPPSPPLGTKQTLSGCRSGLGASEQAIEQAASPKKHKQPRFLTMEDEDTHNFSSVYPSREKNFFCSRRGYLLPFLIFNAHLDVVSN